MNKRLLYIIAAVVVILVALGGYFMVRNNNTTTNQNNNTPAQSTTTQSQPTTTQAENLITIKGFAFSPSDLKIKKGTTVTWKNEDSVTHTVKSDSFVSKDLATGDTFQFTFDTAGTFSYICSIHPSMTGTVTVE